MGRGSQSSSSFGKTIWVKVKTKEGEAAHFELSSGSGADRVEEGTEKKLSGFLTGVQHRLSDYQGKVTDKIQIKLTDPKAGDNGETYVIETSTIGSIGRNIMNSLLNLEDTTQEIALSLYNNKDNGYPNIGIYAGGEMLKWKYGIEEQAKYVSEVEVKEKDSKGKIVTRKKKEFLGLADFLLNEVKEKFKDFRGAVNTADADEPAVSANAPW